MNNPESATPPSLTQKQYIPALDGLRGLAILMIVCYHYFALEKWTKFGWMGVDVFFVLSGYLITLQLTKKTGSRNYFSNFYRNRILRIWPLYFLALIVFYLIINFVVSAATSHNFQYHKENAWAFVMMVQNFLFIQKGLPSQPHLNHLWSLAVEEQFYLIWPFLLVLLPKNNIHLLIWFLLLPLVIGFRCFQYFHYPVSGYSYYFNTFCRFDSFLIGASVFFFSKRTELVTAGKSNRICITIAVIIACILTGAGNYNLTTAFFGSVGYTFVAILTGCVIYLIIYYNEKIVVSVFSCKLLVQLGKISFGIYVIHYPLYHFLVQFWNYRNPYFQENFPRLNYFGCGIVCFALTYVLSSISYKYIESYFLKFKAH